MQLSTARDHAREAAADLRGARRSPSGRRTHGQTGEPLVIERDDPLARTEPRDHFTEISGSTRGQQSALDAACERRRDQFVEAAYHLDPR